MNLQNTLVQHDGGYVLTLQGSKDFGEIPEDIAKQIGRQENCVLELDIIMIMTIRKTMERFTLNAKDV